VNSSVVAEGEMKRLEGKNALIIGSSWKIKMAAKLNISIIIPVLNEEEMLLKMSDRFSELKQTAEVIFVDGESSDGTVELASQLGKVLKGKKGRGVQMNLGAKKATGDILLFLHADAYINKRAVSSVRECIHKGAVGGCFTQRLNNKFAVYRYMERQGTVRAKKTKIFYGDQGIFVRRDIFFALGGYPEVPVMEDILFSRKLRRAGKVECLDDRIYVSARRWEKHGFFKTNILYNIILLLFSLHIPLRIIKYLYKDKR